jgi:protein TonB
MAPRELYKPEPVYPPIARLAHAQGVVTIDALIDEHGDVVQARAIEGPPLLIPSALAAVLKWKYEPTYLDGEPVSIKMHVEVRFTLL